MSPGLRYDYQIGGGVKTTANTTNAMNTQLISCMISTLYEHVLIDTVSAIRTGCAHNGGGVTIIAKSSETCRTQG